MKRFIASTILLSAAATLLWWATAPWSRSATIALAKMLHALVGYPAPHLLADLDDYYWFAPLFPPLVGLVLASHWITPSRRAVGLLIGLAAFAYLVALQIAVVYSPYLTLSAARAYLMSAQIALNSVVVPVILWFTVTGGPPADWSRATTRTGRSARPVRPEHRSIARMAALMAVFCGLMTLPLPLPASETTPALSAARRRAGRAIAADRPESALQAIDAMFTAQRSNAALSYLEMRLYARLGDRESADRVMPNALTTQQRQRAYRALRE